MFHKFSAREALLFWEREWGGKEVVLGRLLPGANPEPRTCVQGVYWGNAPGKLEEGVEEGGPERGRSQARQAHLTESSGM